MQQEWPDELASGDAAVSTEACCRQGAGGGIGHGDTVLGPPAARPAVRRGQDLTTIDDHLAGELGQAPAAESPNTGSIPPATRQPVHRCGKPYPLNLVLPACCPARALRKNAVRPPVSTHAHRLIFSRAPGLCCAGLGCDLARTLCSAAVVCNHDSGLIANSRSTEAPSRHKYSACSRLFAL